MAEKKKANGDDSKVALNKGKSAGSVGASGSNTSGNSNVSANGDSDELLPTWLKNAQAVNKSKKSENHELANDSLGNVKSENEVIKSALKLQKHEENVELDDEGKVVLDNVAGSPEKLAFNQQKEEIKDLEFEGQDQSEVPVWLKKINSENVDGNDNSIDDSMKVQKTLIEEAEKHQEISKKDLKKDMPKNEKEEVKKAVQKDVKNTAAVEKVAQSKQNLWDNLKSFFGQTKEEFKNAKNAGVDEANITLENFEEVKAAKNQTQGSKEATKDPNKVKTELEERKELLEAEKVYQEGMATVRDLIAPSSMDINYDHLRVEGMYARTFIIYSYPRYLDTNWMSPIVNFDATLDIAQFIYPIDSAKIMKILQRKVTQMQSAMHMNAEKGLIRDPGLETAYEDAEQLRTQIQRGQEKFFQFAMYVTIYAKSLKKIDKISKQMESILGSRLIITKRSDLRMEHGFNSTSPMCLDELEVIRNMNTGPLSTSFPFTSSDLTSNEGILYGLNRHNDSLVIFDRFSLPNANATVFAMSGAGKSYAVKLEILRYLMLGVDVIVIDPENEYEELTKTVGGSYLRMSLTSDRRINPFDLPSPLKDEEVQPGDLLRSNIITLQGLLKVMLGGSTPLEEGMIDKALNDVYALKGITMDIVDPSNLPVPTMEDLHELLKNMDGAKELAQKLQKYTAGTYAGIFNKPTNIDLKSGLMVFSIRDLDDSLRPIAMYIILHYIWNKVRSSLKKRILVVDEAWKMMEHEDSAKFLFGLVKRARKYYLGITTVTQDVEDFIQSSYGKPIVTNSSMQILLKQAPAAISVLQKIFNLTEGEKYMLLNSGIGQGLFFAGQKHVAIQIIASYMEDKIVTTNPEEILKGLNKGEDEVYE